MTEKNFNDQSAAFSFSGIPLSISESRGSDAREPIRGENHISVEMTVFAARTSKLVGFRDSQGAWPRTCFSEEMSPPS
jgi:hypothetical protein